MPQVEFSALITEVLSVAAACPTPTIIRNARNAAIELAEKAECMRYDLEGDLAIAEMPEVEFSLPPESVLVKPIVLDFDGSPLTPVSARIMNKDVENWREACAHPPKHYLRSQNTLDAVRLYPIPINTGTVTGEVAIKPTRDALGIEEIFMDRFFAVLVDGTLARLLAIPSAPWFSPDGSSYHKGEFYASLDEAKREADADDLPKLRLIKYGGM